MVIIKNMEMPKECHGCRFFWYKGMSKGYYLDARCELIPSTQDWNGPNKNGGWCGEDITHIPGCSGYYYYHHCVREGERAVQCPMMPVEEVRK